MEPLVGDCGRPEPMEDLADTGAAELLIEPPGDRHGPPGDRHAPPIAAPRLGEERHTTIGHCRKEEEEEDEATPWGIVGIMTTGVTLS